MLIKVVLRVLFACAFTAMFLASCASEPDRLMATVHQIRIKPEFYDNKTVIVKGYLSRMLTENTGPVFLFASKEDAYLRNFPAGVFVDIPGDARDANMSRCLEHHVQVIGVFREVSDPSGNPGFGITDLELLKIYSPVGQSSTQDERKDTYCVLPGGQKQSGT